MPSLAAASACRRSGMTSSSAYAARCSIGSRNEAFQPRPSAKDSKCAIVSRFVIYDCLEAPVRQSLLRELLHRLSTLRSSGRPRYGMLSSAALVHAELDEYPFSPLVENLVERRDHD